MLGKTPEVRVIKFSLVSMWLGLHTGREVRLFVLCLLKSDKQKNVRRFNFIKHICQIRLWL